MIRGKNNEEEERTMKKRKKEKESVREIFHQDTHGQHLQQFGEYKDKEKKIAREKKSLKSRG